MRRTSGDDGIALGLDTFGDRTAEPDGSATSYAQVIRDVIDQGVLADQVGVDAFGVGEHHRADFAISAPDMVLAAIAGRTRRITLGSAVTVLGSDDPVRVFQRFATLDAASGGRAEVTVGRGSFTESFPLFGHRLDDYETLFEERLALFAALLDQRPVTWQGTTRASLTNQAVFPPVDHAPLPTWVGVGGSPQSVVRAARHGMRLMLAVIGGDPMRFAPWVALYRQSLRREGRADLPVGVHSPGFVADSDAAARETFWPHYQAMHDAIGRDRGWPPLRREQFEAEADGGSMYVGSPATVAGRIAATVRGLGIQRFDLKYSAGTLPHEAMLRCIELYGTEVAPRVRALLTREQAA